MLFAISLVRRISRELLTSFGFCFDDANYHATPHQIAPYIIHVVWQIGSRTSVQRHCSWFWAELWAACQQAHPDRRASSTYVGLEQSAAYSLTLHYLLLFTHLSRLDLTIATRLCSAAEGLSVVPTADFSARLILNIPKFGRITTTMRDTLHWLPVRQRIAFKICMLVHNCVNGSAPIYLQEICNSVSADVHRPRADHATWSCRAPTLTDSVGAVFLCPGRTSGTS